MSTIPKPPEILDKIVDLVLAHRPKPKSKSAKTDRDLTSPNRTSPERKRSSKKMRKKN